MKRTRKLAREPKSVGTEHTPPKRQTKSAEVLAMLMRAEGATLDQLVAATEWLPHTARAALTGLKKKGHVINSDKPAGSVRTYRIKQAAEATR
jgi:homoserine dehydrogenase